MPIDPYVSLDDFKAEIGIKVDVDDDTIQKALEAASESIERECDRDFHVPASTGADTVRYYTPERPRTLEIDDCLEVLELATDLAGNGNFTSIWVENKDFVLEPLNNPAKHRPYERIVIHPWARFTLAPLPRSVRVTAVFGWPEVPSGVVQMTTILANKLRLRAKTAPFGVANFGQDIAMRLLGTDPDMPLLLGDLLRDPILYG